MMPYERMGTLTCPLPILRGRRPLREGLNGAYETMAATKARRQRHVSPFTTAIPSNRRYVAGEPASTGSLRRPGRGHQPNVGRRLLAQDHQHDDERRDVAGKLDQDRAR